ncbi:hypothetical protein BDZ45DRAFT_741644 [Acephala macrosclerotiorum]|nr:hypothetical protein BDZ45DRAFT_741644 [Acephala macrosclerotiorum]
MENRLLGLGSTLVQQSAESNPLMILADGFTAGSLLCGAARGERFVGLLQLCILFHEETRMRILTLNHPVFAPSSALVLDMRKRREVGAAKMQKEFVKEVVMQERRDAPKAISTKLAPSTFFINHPTTNISQNTAAELRAELRHRWATVRDCSIF